MNDILPLLPACAHYCEPFAGSAAVLLNRQPSPIETLNDLNADIVNFFQMLRDEPDRLIDALLLTPYARKEFYQAWLPHPDPVERARRFFVRAVMDIAKAGAKKDKSFSTNVKYCPGQHSYTVNNFITKVANLPALVARLRMVQVENKPALAMIKKYDRPGTLFYCDPPYLPSTRTSSNDYVFEMSTEDHIELAKTLNDCKGMVALSGYDDPFMDEHYPASRWFKTGFKKRRVPMSHTGKRRKIEVLWTNYDPFLTRGQTSFQLV
ncbi:MAG: DNA adenine methylase [Lewinellaceae bacterium]|nr:DNA adenine methylase [Lewinellaceae bacterium]